MGKEQNWRNVLLEANATMRQAIEKLDTEALRIVLAVDGEQRLLGTITDGDIRRALLSHLNMETSISKIMNTDPVKVSSNESQSKILSLMKDLDLLHIPIIDQEGKVVGLETLQHLTEIKKLDNPVFLMAGGFGKRLRPLTDNTPKPLLKVGDTPILQSILESFVSYGFHKFYISTHYRADMIRDHFGDGSSWGISIEYVHEDEPLGTAGAIGLLPKEMPELPIVMMNGDLLTKVNFENLIEFHNKRKGSATMCVREYDFQVPYGVVKAEDQKVKRIVEKPVHKFFVNAGIYVISSELRRSVFGRGAIDMPDLLQEEITASRIVNMFPIHEYWLDIGRIEDFERAQTENLEVDGS